MCNFLSLLASSFVNNISKICVAGSFSRHITLSGKNFFKTYSFFWSFLDGLTMLIYFRIVAKSKICFHEKPL